MTPEQAKRLNEVEQTPEEVTFISVVQPGLGTSKLYGELAARSCMAPFIGKMVEVTVRIKTWD